MIEYRWSARDGTMRERNEYGAAEDGGIDNI